MKTFIKKNIRFIIVVVVCITCSVLTTFATEYLFNSSEVKYDNTQSGIQAGDVQGAIDELYACASNYATYNQRLTNAENTIGSGSLTTTPQNLIGAINGLNDQLTMDVTQSSDAYQNIQIVRLGKIRLFHYIRKNAVPNNTVVTTLNTSDRPSSNISTYSWYKQASGYGVVLLTVGSDGKVALGAVSYNEDVAGDFIAVWSVA